MIRKLLLSAVCLFGLIGCDVLESSDPKGPPVYDFIRVDLISSISERRGFGSSIAISDDWAFASASSCRGTYESEDAVAVFSRTGESWIEHQVLERPDDLRGFGCYTTTAGRFMATTAGATEDAVGGVVIYQLAGDRWEILQTIRPGGEQWEYQFGRIISMSGNRLVVGNLTSSVRVYHYDGSRFELEQTLVSPDETVRWYARDIDLEGGILAVGSGPNGNKEIRALHVYEYTGDRWELAHSEYRETGEESYFFANSFAVDGAAVIVGSRSSHDNVIEGGVEVFSLSGYQSTVIGAIDSTGVDRDFAMYLDADENRFVVSEEDSKRLRVFEKHGGGYIDLGSISDTLSETAFHHADLEMHGRWIGVSNYFDRVATMYRLRLTN